LLPAPLCFLACTCVCLDTCTRVFCAGSTGAGTGGAGTGAKARTGVTQAQVLGLGVVMVGRKTILERKKYNGKIIETGVEIFS